MVTLLEPGSLHRLHLLASVKVVFLGEDKLHFLFPFVGDVSKQRNTILQISVCEFLFQFVGAYYGYVLLPQIDHN